jgi:hypothetical protein
MNRNFGIGTFAPVMLMLMLMSGVCSAEGVQTKFTAVNESLEMLLDEGWGYCHWRPGGTDTPKRRQVGLLPDHHCAVGRWNPSYRDIILHSIELGRVFGQKPDHSKCNEGADRPHRARSDRRARLGRARPPR